MDNKNEIYIKWRWKINNKEGRLWKNLFLNNYLRNRVCLDTENLNWKYIKSQVWDIYPEFQFLQPKYFYIKYKN